MANFHQKRRDVNSQQNAENIHNGIPFEQYKADLAEKEMEIRRLLVDAALTDNDKLIRERELADVGRLRQDEKASYDAHVQDLKVRIERLDQVKGELPDRLIKDAQEALSEKDNGQVEALFTQVEEQAAAYITAAAEVAYQRGKLAEDRINYCDAFKRYQRSVELSPGNPEYLSAAGAMAGTVSNYQKQIDWTERALQLCLEQESEEPPVIARMRNNLGVAWESKGEYDKAISYFEQALAGNLESLGEDHPVVAAGRNNLGETWRAKGEYDKAIGYYEQALSSDLKSFGESHPKVAIRRNNIGLAWDSKGEYDKAICYFEQALVSFEKMLGLDHPSTISVVNNLGNARLQASGSIVSGHRPEISGG